MTKEELLKICKDAYVQGFEDAIKLLQDSQEHLKKSFEDKNNENN